ncbi:MAG: pyridoxamine 5'-phosphate oxidase [Acidimicrobiia bacterium]|nr:pyridoxamine 5'-phosphate oxidase [Acidimicrobiia bacterium]
MGSVAEFEALVPIEHGLSTVAISRVGRPPHATVVNAGVVQHPATGEPMVAFVAAGHARKLAYLRTDPSLAVTIRAGWRWVTVEGRAELIGPDDPHLDVDDERRRLLLREVFSAAGGRHDDWDSYDLTMREERRVAILVTVDHVYSNPR